MLNIFRIISMLEGVSYLLLLLVAIPAKYYFGQPVVVTVIGALHGGLFVVYSLGVLAVAQRYNWDNGFVWKVMAAGVVPFACFWLEQRLKKEALGNTLQPS